MVMELKLYYSIVVFNFFQFAAELEVHPNGQWMYVSNRNTGAIIVFQIQQDGTLTFVQVSML